MKTRHSGKESRSRGGAPITDRGGATLPHIQLMLTLESAPVRAVYIGIYRYLERVPEAIIGGWVRPSMFDRVRTVAKKRELSAISRAKTWKTKRGHSVCRSSISRIARRI